MDPPSITSTELGTLFCVLVLRIAIKIKTTLLDIEKGKCYIGAEKIDVIWLSFICVHLIF